MSELPAIQKAIDSENLSALNHLGINTSDEYKKWIDCAVDQMLCAKQEDAPVVHRFSPGIYAREIFMQAGTVVVGHIHKTKHLNIVLSGEATVMIDGQIVSISAPCVFESEAGVRKVLLIEEDMRWMTIHANPSGLEDVVKLEEELIEASQQFFEEKGQMTVDQFRHYKSNQFNTPELV